MLAYSIRKPEGILVLEPGGPLTKADFDGLRAAVDAYLQDHPKLHGLMIHIKAFPGWESFAGFAAHLNFIRDHHKKVERIAVVTDVAVAALGESLARHFTSAEVKRFPYADEARALEWLTAPMAKG